MISFASVKGPSVTVTLPLDTRTRVLCAVGARPPVLIMEPSLTLDSTSLSIAAIRAGGGAPGFSPCLTIIMNRIVLSLSFIVIRFWAAFDGFDASLQYCVEVARVKSTTSKICFCGVTKLCGCVHSAGQGILRRLL